MKINLRWIYIGYVICFLSSVSFSQRKFRANSWMDGYSIIPKLGLGSVIGELGNVVSLKPIYGIGLEKGITEKVNIGLEIVGGSLNGSEDYPYFSRFENDFFQIHLSGIANISRILSDSYQRKNVEFRAFGGLGWVWFHAEVYDLKSNNFLRTTADGTTRHTTLFRQSGVGVGNQGIFYTRELVIPIGIRLDGRLDSRVTYVVSLGYNWVYNDKFDATTPYNLSFPTIIGGENSYSDTANDGWINLSVGLKYKFETHSYRNQRGLTN
jgi:hypothetical protein